MFDEELGTFIYKFRQLCRAGLDAHLAVDAHAGEAWVHIRVRLGHVPEPLYEEPQKTRKNKNSHSRQRRRARRLAERLKKNEETEKVDNNSNEIEAEEALVIDECESSDAEEEQQHPIYAIADDAVAEKLFDSEGEAFCFECWHCEQDCWNEEGLQTHLKIIHGEVYEEVPD